MTDLATLPTGVYLRPGSSVFHLRIGVPKDLQQHFRNPKTGKPKADAFRASLRTSNRAEAGTRAHEIIAEWQRRFEALRAKNEPAPFVTLTPALAQQFKEAVRRRILGGDDGFRFGAAGNDKLWMLARQGYAGWKRDCADALSRGKLDFALGFAPVAAYALLVFI